MRDLPPDTIALAERLEALPTRPGVRGAEQQEILSLLTWVSCFSTYIAVLAESSPERSVDLLAYMRIIIREAHKHGGHGWMTYDTVFRRNQHKDPSPWNALDPSVHAAYILGQACHDPHPLQTLQ